MIENIIITKSGSESDNPQNTIYSITTPWENNGSNLIVYINGSPIDRDNYVILDSWRLQFNNPLSNNDELKFILTRLDLTIESKVDRFDKIIQGKTQTAVEKSSYEETIPTKIITHSDDIWSSTISESTSVALSEGVVQQLYLFELTQDVTVAGRRGWYASTNGFLSGRIRDWVPPQFGQGYHLRLFDQNDVEITSSSPIEWSWDYASGYLTILNPHDHITPFKISGYQYIGSYGVDLDGVSHWKNPVPTFDQLPTEGNINGDARIVLEDNTTWRWDSLKAIWIKLISSQVKESVQTLVDLENVYHYPEDIRLVIDENIFYRYDGDLEEWVKILFEHDHNDIYYTETEMDQLLTHYSPIQHIHDSLYFRQHEVTNMVRWRVSVETDADLPEHTSSRDGDVILVRNSNTIYSWDSDALPLGKWVPIISGNLTWKMPVQDITMLPSDNNREGDVRMVLDEGDAYWWDGTQWLQFTNADHDHNDLYFTKDEINVMVRWLPPVVDFSSLPLVDNTDGDIRLTLDDNSIFRWSEIDGEWQNVSSSSNWKSPVELFTSLPMTGNDPDDIRIAKDTLLIYMWDDISQMWNVVSNPPHSHDDRYYTQTQLDDGILDARYYTEDEIDDMFDPSNGHNHNGINSQQIDYNDLLNIPYFYWKPPVANFSSLPQFGNTTGDARITLNENGLYVWSGAAWILINSGLFAPVNHIHDDMMIVIIQKMRLMLLLQIYNYGLQIN